MLGLAAFLHERFGYALIAFAVILGAWGGFQFATRRAVSGGFRSGFLLMIGLTGVQGVAGIIAMLLGGQPRELLHLVYGAFAILFLPGVYVYAVARRRDAEAAVLTVACWVVVIAYARGISTGH